MSWVLGCGCWVLGIGWWVLGIGYWVLGIGWWVMGVRCWVLGGGFWVVIGGFGALIGGFPLPNTHNPTPITHNPQPKTQNPIPNTHPQPNTHHLFTDITEAAGITFFHVSSPDKKHIIDSMSGGVALFDYDNDGWVDLYFVNSLTVETATDPRQAPSRLYHNKGDGSFSDVTGRSGLGFPGWGMGVAAADFNGDGWTDLYVTCLGPNRLYRNNGDGTFTDVAGKAGVADDRWSAGAAFADYDGDGDLDLFVANYVDARLDRLEQFGAEPHCRFQGIAIQCDPRMYGGAGDSLFQNNGDGTFTDVSRTAGVADEAGSYGMGAVWTDFDRDGRPDLFVANDSRPSFLYHNQGDGTFREIGFLAGVAVAEEGIEQGSMGVAVGDYDRDGHVDLFVTNFAYEYNSLYRQERRLLFLDEAIPSRTADAGLPLVGWGTEFFDYDNDGWLDLLAVNGHLYPQVEQLPGVGQRVAAFSAARRSRYAQPKLLYRNNGDRTFIEMSARLGEALAQPRVSRGAAVADLDNDGDLDIAVNDLDGPAMVLRNDGGNRQGNWIRVRLEGPPGNRSAIGARVRVSVNGSIRESEVRSGGSYLSQCDFRQHFGLGRAEGVEWIEVVWPGGDIMRVERISANREITLRFGESQRR